MKVLIVNASDIEGGAARAAYRLHCSLIDSSLDSRMLVQRKYSDCSTVIGCDLKIHKLYARLQPVLDGLPIRHYKQRSKTLFSTAWVPFGGVVDRINSLKPDIVHLHWIAGGMMRLEHLAKIRAPVVWSLHDMWPFTGGCHYDENCGAYRKNCGNCPVLQSGKQNDLSSKVFSRKQKAFARKKDITIIGLSRWLANEARASTLFSQRKVVNLPNPIDITVFSPFDKVHARELLGLPQDKRLILFGAMGATSDPRKGFRELSLALRQMNTQGVELVVFGASQPSGSVPFSQRAHYLGRLHDDVALRVLYSAADVMVVPSLQENLSNAIMESSACGIPVVGFDIGGNSDLIEHKINGYLAKPFSTQDLADGIDWILQHEDRRSLEVNARRKVVESFDSKIVAKQHIDLYRDILNKDK